MKIEDIKFRAFCRGKMYYGAVQWHPAERGEWLIPTDDGNLITKDAIPMQFTGLSNIYDGDYVRVKHDEYYSNSSFSVDVPDGEKNWTFTGLVEMRNFCWCIVYGYEWIPFSDLDDMDVEVVGNVHENKEKP